MGLSGTIKGITIQLGADTTKLSKALGDAQKATRGLQSDLKNVERGLKFDPGSATLLSNKMNILKEKVDAAKQKVDALKQAQAKLDAQGVDKNSEEYKKLQREIDLAESEVKQLESELKRFGSVGAQQVAAVGEKMKTIGQGVTNVGKTLTQYVTAPIAAGFGASVKEAASFESQMSKVQAISGANAGQMDELEKVARKMGASTKFSAKEAGEAYEYMGMAGWKADQMIAGIPGILNLAAASGEDLGKTSDIVTDGLTAFGLSAKDAGSFSDVLAAASTNANTNVSMLGESFKYVAPVAGSMGYSVQDISAALGLMANSGIKASSAGTSLRTLLTNMANPSDKMAAAMDNLGVSLDDGEGHMYSFREIMDKLRVGFGDIKMPVDEYNERLCELQAQYDGGGISEAKYVKELQSLTKQAYGAEGSIKAQNAAMLAGKTGMAGLLAIVSASDEDYEKMTQAIDGASQQMAMLKDGSVVPLSEALKSGEEVVKTYNGTAEAMAAVMRNNLEGQFTELKSAVSEAAIAIGSQFLPEIKNIVKGIQDWVAKFNGLDDSQKKFIATVALVVAAIGPILMVIGSVITKIGMLLTFAPAIVTAFGAVSTFFTATLIPAIGGVIAAIAPIVVAFAPFIAIAAAVVAAGVLIYKNWDTIKNKAGELVSAVREKFEQVRATIAQKLEAAKLVVTVILLALKVLFTEALNTIKTTVSNAFEAVKNFFKTKLEAARAIVDSVLNAIKTFFTNALNTIKTTVSNALEAVRNFFQSKLNAAKSAVDSALSAIKSAFTSGMNAAKSAVDSALNTIKSAFGKLNEVKSTVSSALGGIEGEFRSKLDAAHKVVTDMINKIKDIFNGLKLKLDIKVPHISVSGGEAPFGIGGKGKLPKFSVEWYDKGGIFNHPSIIGVGEKRPEFVGALDDLRAIVREEAGGGAMMQELVRLMTIMVEQGGRPITVNQEIYADSTSYAEQQRQAAREFRNIARALT